MLKKITFLIIILMGLKTHSQCTLDSNDLENIRQHSLEMLEYLDDSFQKLSASKDPVGKEGLIKNLLTDFTESCTIEVVNRSGTRTHKIEDYLRNVLNKRYRKQFKLVNIDIVKFELDKMVPSTKEPGTYIIKGSFVQIFSTGSTLDRDKEGIIKYKEVDTTIKEFKVIIKPETGPNGCTFSAKIDNITVKSVKFL